MKLSRNDVFFLLALLACVLALLLVTGCSTQRRCKCDCHSVYEEHVGGSFWGELHHGNTHDTSGHWILRGVKPTPDTLIGWGIIGDVYDSTHKIAHGRFWPDTLKNTTR